MQVLAVPAQNVCQESSVFVQVLACIHMVKHVKFERICSINCPSTDCHGILEWYITHKISLKNYTTLVYSEPVLFFTKHRYSCSIISDMSH